MAYIQLRNITKKFGSVYANRRICLDIHKGEIHALLGGNGSGKTTLMNILAGRYKYDEGNILIDGRKAVFHSPGDSVKAGIGMIHQHVDLVDSLSVEENILAGTEKGLFPTRKKARGKIKDLAELYDFHVEPEGKVYQLTIGGKQAVEILKVFYRGASVLILDEPTSVLAPIEARALFVNLGKMKENGCAIVLITHKMQEVFDISDRVTVLRKGEAVYTSLTADTGQSMLTEKMVGHAIEGRTEYRAAPRRDIRPLLAVSDVTVHNRFGSAALSGVSLDIRPGEIHGIAGAAGSGQKELCDVIAGIAAADEGRILYNGKDIAHMPIAGRAAKGVRIGYVPEDRMDTGLVGGMCISDNVMLRRIDREKGLFFNEKKARDLALRIIGKYGVDAVDPAQKLKDLSGGNIQKILLGREIEEAPDLLITAYPVRGLDIGATNYIFGLLRERRDSGMAILFVGEDTDVLLELCDRISTLYRGRLTATLDAAGTTKAELGLFMAGGGTGGTR
ncbi:MAG: ABC transporter ATP-binding protein [Clostridiales Family XIII bacterium]|jgi:simple sugar transport system ATP-binding protein|nr:ABC transporter ATP-binding protein [Clostridiales Family XIII bacterium]